jgi:hypothetical protein
MAVFLDAVPCNLVEFYDILGVLAVCIIRVITALMMEAASTSETFVNLYQTTWCNIPEESHFLTFVLIDKNYYL